MAAELSGVRGHVESAVARDGQVFDARAAMIVLRCSDRRVAINFRSLPMSLTDSERESIRAYVVHCLETVTAETARFRFACIVQYAKQMKPSEKISSLLALRRFKTSADERNHPDLIRYLRQYFEYSSERYPGVCDPELLLEASLWRAKARQTHLAVSEGDPEEGPLTPAEESALRSTLDKAQFDEATFGSIDGLTCRNIIRTMLNVGCRPYQTTLLIEDDVIEIDPQADAYGLYVPRIKNGQPTRSAMRLRPITRAHFQALQAQIQANKKLDRGDDRTLFPKASMHPDDESGCWRVTPNRLSYSLARWASVNSLRQSDSDQALHLYPYRLRYTFATNLAAELSPAELADVLDHTTLESVMVYFELRPDFMDRLGAALEVRWSRLARLFRGEIKLDIPSNADATKVIYPSTFSARISRLGLCGSLTLCSLYPPLSCYLCPKFQVDPDADHEAILSDLIAVQENRLEQTQRTRDRLKAQLDAVITAIKQLLEIVKALKWIRGKLLSGESIPRTSDGLIDMVAIATSSGADAHVVSNDQPLRNLIDFLARESSRPPSPKRRARR